MKPNIISLKYLLPLIFCLVTGLACQCSAQNNKKVDSNNYDSIIKKISVLNHFDLKKYDSLTVINEDTFYKTIHDNKDTSKEDMFFWRRGRDSHNMLIGWLIGESKDSIYFLESSGIKFGFKKERAKSIRKIGINDSLTDLINYYCWNYTLKLSQWWWHGVYYGDESMPFYLVALWLYQNGNTKAAYKILKTGNKGWNYYSEDTPLDITIERLFGNLYYNLMLHSYTMDRDYAKAIEYGGYFNYTDFKDFYYIKTAIELTDQLKKRKDDFKSFCLPDSLSWIKLKSKMDRKEQFIYLAERIRLLNCRQHGQPDDVNLDDPQNAGSNYINLRYHYIPKEWQSLKVINPYNEILAMKPKISEVETLLPYLNDTSYIPTYWYWRDFSSSRELYRFNKVIEDIIFKITNEHFFQIDSFNCLTADKKKLEIEKIREWCSKNSSLSKEELNRKILSETWYWDAFKSAMDAAVKSGDTSIIEILVRRYNDSFSYDNVVWPTRKGRIAQAIYSLGSVKDTVTIRSWFKNTDDDCVKMWTSLFLMKFDKEYYEKAFDTLSIALKNNSGCYYYVIKPLISFKNERALKLAEGIFNKRAFETPVNYIDNKDQIKLLFLAKSEAAFKFLYTGLMNLDTSIYSGCRISNGSKVQGLCCDPYVEVVDKWRTSKKHNYWDWDVQKRRKYSKELAKWLKKQFELICADKKHQIIIEPDDTK